MHQTMTQKYLRYSRRLNSKGILHHILPLLIVVIFAVAGVGYLVYSNADSAHEEIVTASGNYCLDGSFTNSAVLLRSCSKTKAQSWTVNASAKAGTFVNASTGLCLNVNGERAVNYAWVNTVKCNSAQAQQWTINGSAIESSLSSAAHSYCLDDNHLLQANINTQIDISQCNSTATEEWNLQASGTSSTGGGGGSTSASQTSNRWLMDSNLLGSFLSQDPASARYFFNTYNAFDMNSSGSAVTGLLATPIRNYKSYAAFAQDIANNAIPSTVHWVMYDNEDWSYTPVTEAQHPAKYMKLFAELAHKHNLKVYEVPARDLMNVAGADCGVQSGETLDAAYIRCGIPADAQYADIYEVQAQADQSSTTAYANLVVAAKNQIRASAPHITFMSGLTTDRADTVTQIVNCWKATHTDVQGYWMNSTASTFNVASQALDQIRGYGG
jgi:hypothetical protein